MTTANPIAQGLGDMKLGFSDPVFQSQSVFRTLLNANAYAGRIHTLAIEMEAPAPLDMATAAVTLTLCDFDTTLWLDGKAADSAALAYLQFHSGAPVAALTQKADFAIVTAPEEMPHLDDFAIGEDRYPDRSATLIVQVPSLTEGPATTWSGPGIETTNTLHIAGLPESFWQQWRDNHALYPLGVDVVFTCGRDIVAMPRTIAVEG
jgi:alpha-D-ribose 1-methylphosphonate 5-triphosphate synthase subunit PhnH